MDHKLKLFKEENSLGHEEKPREIKLNDDTSYRLKHDYKNLPEKKVRQVPFDLDKKRKRRQHIVGECNLSV